MNETYWQLYPGDSSGAEHASERQMACIVEATYPAYCGPRDKTIERNGSRIQAYFALVIDAGDSQAANGGILSPRRYIQHVRAVIVVIVCQLEHESCLQ